MPHDLERHDSVHVDDPTEDRLDPEAGQPAEPTQQLANLRTSRADNKTKGGGLLGRVIAAASLFAETAVRI